MLSRLSARNCGMTTPRPTTSLNPHEDLQIALAVGASCQGAIQHADTKAAVLLAAQTAAVTIVAATGHTGLSAGHPGPAIAAVVRRLRRV